jgi:hypothetical protein
MVPVIGHDLEIAKLPKPFEGRYDINKFTHFGDSLEDP